MSDVFFEVHGLKALEKKLNNLEKKTAKKGVRKGSRAAGNVILKKVRSNAKSMVGGTMGNSISKMMVLRAWKKQKKGKYGVIIRPKGSGDPAHVYETKEKNAQGKPKRYYIPFALEYGHAFPGRGGFKGAPKDVKPIPYMRKSFQQTKKQAFKAMIKGMNDWINTA